MQDALDPDTKAERHTGASALVILAGIAVLVAILTGVMVWQPWEGSAGDDQDTAGIDLGGDEQAGDSSGGE